MSTLRPKDRFLVWKWDSASSPVRMPHLSQSAAPAANRGGLRGTIASPTDTDGVRKAAQHYFFKVSICAQKSSHLSAQLFIHSVLRPAPSPRLRSARVS